MVINSNRDDFYDSDTCWEALFVLIYVWSLYLDVYIVDFQLYKLNVFETFRHLNFPLTYVTFRKKYSFKIHEIGF